MKLAEALVLRADTQRRIAQLQERISLSVIVQEGDQPPENPQELLNELDRLLSQLSELIARINRTNSQTSLADYASLTDALAERDALRLRFSVLKNIANSASQRVPQYSRSEIRQVVTVDIAALRRQSDQMARRFRELDTAIQAANWSTDLL